MPANQENNHADAAFEAWALSGNIDKLFQGSPSDECLRNRLERAFMAGWCACEKQGLAVPGNQNKETK